MLTLMWFAQKPQLKYFGLNNIEAAAIHKISFHKCENGLAGRYC